MKPLDIEPGKKYRGYYRGKEATAALDGARLLEVLENPVYKAFSWMEEPGQSIPAGVEAAKGKGKKNLTDDRNVEEPSPADGPASGGAGDPAE
jgi:hypothetical protein